MWISTSIHFWPAMAKFMKNVPDAENYKRRENKDLFNQVFIRNRHLDRLCEPAISFLVVGRDYVRWCFRERSYANISPKVREGVEYQVFYGLFKALNVGRSLAPGESDV